MMGERSLSALLAHVTVKRTEGLAPSGVAGVACDSRRVVPGGLFVAVPGSRVDGHAHIEGAVAAGAAVVVCERLPARLAEACYVVVPSSAEALGELASAWYGYPSQRLRLVGVTGTNGKTTIATLLYRLARLLGHEAGLLSTVTYCVGAQEYTSTHTTPDALRLNELLAQMVAAGCEYAFIEVSSHAVAQRRIAGLRFAGGIFTNITRDHLDYHGTFMAYIQAKKAFFDGLGAGSFSLVNADDAHGSVMVQNCAARPRTYALRRMASYRARVGERASAGMQLVFPDVGREVWVRLIGEFNASNLLAVYGAACELGFDSDAVLRALSALGPVAGRLEMVPGPAGRMGVVDYAHTPDALRNVLETLRAVCVGRLIVVVGAGGDRDRGKRGQMGELAASGSDRVYLTSDNPRGEDPEAILAEMYAGVRAADRGRVEVCADRRGAIGCACRDAQPGDWVLVAGKGHETYQEVRGVRAHFDDREELALAWKSIGG